MKKFYKIENEKAQVGQGTFVPDGFIMYENEPQELIDALTLENKEYELYNKIEEAEKARDKAMLDGKVYTIGSKDYVVSFTKDDGDGLTQVRSAFEIGLDATTIHFKNGTNLPITREEFLPFALWFVNKRNEFFHEK